MDNVDVCVFEELEGVKLPECYRAFITEIGNGGSSYYNSAAGPFYGIFPLGEGIEMLSDSYSMFIDKEPIVYPDITGKEWEEIATVIYNDDTSDEEYDVEMGRIHSGLMPIGSQGCSCLHAIVMVGKYKGRVVNVDNEGGMPRFCYEDNFLDWYERWLDEIIAGELQTNSPVWFGYTMGGAEDVLVEKYFNAKDDVEKQNVIIGLQNKLHLSDETIDAFITEYETASGDLANYLLSLIAKYDYKKAKPILLKLSETDIENTIKIVSWYAKEYMYEWKDYVYSVADQVKDYEILSLCGDILQKANVDYASFFIPHLTSDEVRIRILAIYRIGQLANKKDYKDYFIAAFDDESNEVVRYALQAVRGSVDKSILKDLKKITNRFPEEKDYVLINLNHILKQLDVTEEELRAMEF